MTATGATSSKKQDLEQENCVAIIFAFWIV